MQLVLDATEIVLCTFAWIPGKVDPIYIDLEVFEAGTIFSVSETI